MAERLAADGRLSLEDAAISSWLEELVAAESSFESQLRSLSGNDEDEEVQALLAASADSARRRGEQLSQRIRELGTGEESGKTSVEATPGSIPKLAQSTQCLEEQVVQNLIRGFFIENSACAMYRALSAVAAEAGDWITHELADEHQAEQAEVAQRMLRFIPSRSKIAYNMLTLGEVDLAIDTKAAESRVV